MTKAIEKTLAEKRKRVRKTRTYRLHVCLLGKLLVSFRRTRLRIYLVENARKQLYTETTVLYNISRSPQKRKHAENERTLEEPPGSRHTGQRK